MLWASILLVLAAIVWMLHRYQNDEDMEIYKRIPGPRMLPLIGNALDNVVDRVKVFYLSRKWSTEYKDIYKFYFPPHKTISIYNPEDVETVISSLKYNEKSIIYSFLKPWLKEGLLLSKGEKWHARRKILTPAFHFNILRHFSQVLEDNSRQMVRRLAAAADHDKTDIVPLVSMYALNSICETAMGTRLDEEDSGAGVQYKRAIHKMGELILRRTTRLWLMNDFLFRHSSTGRQQERILTDLHSFPKRVIEERRKYREKYGYDIQKEEDDDLHMNKKNKMAMLDTLLSAEKLNLIDADGVQEEVETFMFEGHDTTSIGIIFCLMLLANHETSQNKIYDECKSIFGDSDRPATMADMQEMKYLECCIKESLRLYPPVPVISRRLGERVQLKSCVVPAGTIVLLHIIDLHRRADIFRLPLQFHPERFLPNNPEFSADSKHPYAYIPFSAGPRNCIGQKFAMLEMKSCISSILRNYQLRPVTTPTDVVFIGDLVLRPNNPIYVKFVKRNVN